MSGAFELGQITITYNRLWILCFTLAVFVILLAMLRYTALGLELREVLTDADGLFAAGTASFHRPGCRLVDGREEISYVTEAEAAAKALSAEVVCMPYPDGELAVNEETQWKIADAMRQYRPDVVITHWQGSIHRDHRNTSINVTEALYFAGLPAFQRDLPAWHPRAVYYAENWEDPYGFQPEVSLDVTDVFPQYLEAITSYELVRGGISSFPYYKYYEALGTIRGAVAGYEKGVALMRPEGARLRKQELLM